MDINGRYLHIKFCVLFCSSRNTQEGETLTDNHRRPCEYSHLKALMLKRTTNLFKFLGLEQRLHSGTVFALAMLTTPVICLSVRVRLRIPLTLVLCTCLESSNTSVPLKLSRILWVAIYG
jgi:hypothetical protein